MLIQTDSTSITGATLTGPGAWGIYLDTSEECVCEQQYVRGQLRARWCNQRQCE